MRLYPVKEHIMCIGVLFLPIDKELVESKIAILCGRGSGNNRAILEALALQGALIKYDIFKALKNKGKETLYSTVSRRVDDLTHRDYLREVGKRTIRVGKRQDESSTFGLTERGFIASLTIESVAENILGIFRKNPHLELPFPRKEVLKIVEETFTGEELKAIGQSLLVGYLKAIPKDLELLKPDQFIAYLFPAFTEAPSVQKILQEKDWFRLLQLPEVFDFVGDLLSTAEKGLEKSLSVIRELRKQLDESRVLTPEDLSKIAS